MSVKQSSKLEIVLESGLRDISAAISYRFPSKNFIIKLNRLHLVPRDYKFICGSKFFNSLENTWPSLIFKKLSEYHIMMTWNPKKNFKCLEGPVFAIKKSTISNIFFALLFLIITLANLGFVYLFKKPNRFWETWATHILAPVSCSVWTKITQPLTFLLIPQKSIPKCQNKLSTDYGCLLRWFQWKNCIGLGTLMDSVFPENPLFYTVKVKN